MLHKILREGCRESRRCSRDTYLQSYITKCTSQERSEASFPLQESRVARLRVESVGFFQGMCACV